MASSIARSNKTEIRDSPAILIPKDQATSEIHDAVEKYMAKARLEGRVIRTKPAAIIEIVKAHLGL